MKERPILFSGPMVQAILAGRKTQTRRLVKLQPDARDQAVKFENGWLMYRTAGKGWTGDQQCPYGVPGDRLWVRENGWERPERTPKMLREGADTWARYYYDADGDDGAQLKEWGFKRRPSIHMPRWACRLELEVIAVRIERLQAISREDAAAEGICWAAEQSPRPDYICPSWFPEKNYLALWDKINGTGASAANPWVWVVEFRRSDTHSERK